MLPFHFLFPDMTHQYHLQTFTNTFVKVLQEEQVVRLLRDDNGCRAPPALEKHIKCRRRTKTYL